MHWHPGYTIRGVQGKWTPWFILGIPVSIVLNVVQLMTLGVILETTTPEVELNEPTLTLNSNGCINDL